MLRAEENNPHRINFLSFLFSSRSRGWGNVDKWSVCPYIGGVGRICAVDWPYLALRPKIAVDGLLVTGVI